MGKKLIETALPLEAISRACADEKAVPRRGHPATLHLWWARRPLAACRAVLFASLVEDPSSCPERFPTEEAQEAERLRLFRIIEELVKWENTTNEELLAVARQEILKATDGHPPPILDPFCSGGSIPLEAQRLGLEVYAGDLNPVAVLITKALIEIPPRFAGQPPVNPEARRRIGHANGWRGASGLAEDVRYYGRWMRDEAERQIGHLYPRVKLPPDHGGGEATAIAWLWARTVRCPNPACGAQMPLVRSFWLSTKKARQAWVEPIIDRMAKTVRFEVRKGSGLPSEAPKSGRGARFRCLVCGHDTDDQHIKDEGMAGRMGSQLMAIVAEGNRARAYVGPDLAQEKTARSAVPEWAPEEKLPKDPRNIWCVQYGLDEHRDLYTSRQLVALTTFCDLVEEARKRAHSDALDAGLVDDGRPLREGGTGALAYADALATYEAFALSKLADWSSSICGWIPSIEGVTHTFARQALPMTWDFAEINPLSSSVGNFFNHVDWVAEAVSRCTSGPDASASQRDAASASLAPGLSFACTDPPYYDNISYADLADFFYVWLRRAIPDIFPELFATLLTPKTSELVASPYRSNTGKAQAAELFRVGLSSAFTRIRDNQDPAFPFAVFYAFKQSENERNDSDGGPTVSSTGWETMLESLLKAGFSINGTWPLRTERGARSIGIGTNALASSIVLVCRPRADSAPVTNRREFLRELKQELPPAMKTLQRESIAPVDLAQAAIGPGMAVFSRYYRVLEADGSPMSVRTALSLINQALDEVLAEQEGEFDPETRWALAWFEQHGTNEGPYGDAHNLFLAKNTANDVLVEAGIVASRGGRIRLLRRDELPIDWDPAKDRRVTIWEVAQHLIRALDQGGEQAAANLVARVGGLGEVARDLAYRLYATCDKKKWAQEAIGYNSLVVAWPEISRLAGSGGGLVQAGLDV